MQTGGCNFNFNVLFIISEAGTSWNPQLPFKRYERLYVSQCVAVCWSVLQCVCSVLQCVAVCCSVLQCVAVCCSVLQCVAVYCSVLQCIAVCCSVLQFVALCVAVCCSARETLRFADATINSGNSSTYVLHCVLQCAVQWEFQYFKLCVLQCAFR